MTPEIKAAIERESKDHENRCWRMEPWLEPTHEKSFKAGAEYGYKLAEEKLNRAKDALERILINPMPWYIDKVAREALEKLGK